MTDSPDSLQVAMRRHQAGQLAEAELLYREILRANPRHADALHLLGLVAHQAGRNDVAVECINQAIAVDGTQAAYHNNLAGAYRALNRVAEARASYQRAMQLDPTYAAAHYNLGLLLQGAGELAAAQQHFEQATRLQPNWAEAHNNLGRSLQDQRKLTEAEAAYRSAIRCRVDFAEALNNLGSVLVALGRFAAAIEPLDEAGRLRPDLAQCRYNLGNAYQGLGQHSEAADSFREAVRIAPEFLAPRCNLAALLQEQGDLAAAAAQYREALRLKPDYVEVLSNFAKLLHDQGKWDESLEYYTRAIEHRPDFVIAHFNRAILYRDKGLIQEAIAGYQEVLRLQPNYAAAYINLGILFDSIVRPDEALECCRKALELGADSAMTRASMANALRGQGRTEEAIAWFRKSLELKLDPVQHSNLLYCLNFDPQYDPPTIFAEHLEWARHHAEPLTAQVLAHPNDRTSERRLRIGYISPHFREHAINYFTEPVLAAHDHERFEIYCYSDTRQIDAVTARLQAAADQWRDVHGQSDEQVARRVRDDRIDILVDLCGHIGENRLLVFARKPAPIQVTYIGYQNTTGMSAMDYRFTDERADPPGLTDPFYTERLIRLPRCFFCYRPSDDAPPISPLPALTAGHVTFGSFNHIAKVMPRVIAAWFAILARVPRSRLRVLANRGGYAERHFHELAASHGIDSARIDVCDKRPRLDYLRLIQQADIALDPFPFNGHTTTCDSIWMGVPVVMLEGHSYASRFGGSVLANVGLERLISQSPEQYVELAVELAADLERLAQLRSELRSRMAGSVLLDFRGFTRNVEHAYRKMWIDWCESR